MLYFFLHVPSPHQLFEADKVALLELDAFVMFINPLNISTPSHSLSVWKRRWIYSSSRPGKWHKLCVNFWNRRQVMTESITCMSILCIALRIHYHILLHSYTFFLFSLYSLLVPGCISSLCCHVRLWGNLDWEITSIQSIDYTHMYKYWYTKMQIF